MELDHKHKIIKQTKEFCFNKIKWCNESLDLIREECDHPETEMCTYQTRPGQRWLDTEVCSVCGEVIKWPYENVVQQEINSWDDGGCSTGLGGDQYEDWDDIDPSIR